MSSALQKKLDAPRIGTLFHKFGRKLLQLAFGFDKWHVSPLQERPYAVDVIRYCNGLHTRDSICEIGCGLGDIIRNVRYTVRLGYDLDRRVLKAASVLPVSGGGTISYKVFRFPDSPLEDKVDVLTMVNWIHHIEPVTLQQKLAGYFQNNILPGGRIVIDTVQDPAYKHNHQIAFLTKGLNCSLFRIGEYARQREVWSIQKL